MKTKKAYLLFELILSIIIASFIIVNSLYFQAYLLKEDKNKRQIEYLKLELINTKIYLQKNLLSLSDLIYKNGNLYFKNTLLLKDLSSFKKEEKSSYFKIDLVLSKQIKNIWLIKK